MTREILESILAGEGAKSTEAGWTFPRSGEVTCFVATGGDMLPVARVVRLCLKKEYLVLETAKEERFAIAYESLLGTRREASGAHKDRGPGFAR